MRLNISKSKNSVSLYVVKSTYIEKKRSTVIVEKLGTIAKLEKTLNGQDPYVWAKEYIAKLNEAEKNENMEVIVKYSTSKQIPKNQKNQFNGGYLFLESIYNNLGLNNICKYIAKKYKFTYDLNVILSHLIYTRILYPSSKLDSFNKSKIFLKAQKFDLQHVYRSLSVLSNESDYIQSTLYNNSLKVYERNSKVLYYDCTNFFFEIEEAEGLKQYGMSKENRPNPIVQMGLFMDGDGIPLAFSINKGNTNEQVTLKPLEQKIIKDYNLSKFVVCTDAGLASTANRKFNNISNRAFITTQSVKMLKKYQSNWAFDVDGWKISGGNDKIYNLNEINDEHFKDVTFYKERWINEDNLEQKLIITYSIKYRNYQRKIRNAQIERASKLIEKNADKIGKKRKTDYTRFISKVETTKDGEVASEITYSLDETLIFNEEKYDGFYGVCTNLEDDPRDIIKINQRRWEVEESFRIMKSEFQARPVYVKRDDRIEAHFMTCYLSLVIFRFLEKTLGPDYTCSQIIDTLQNFDFVKTKAGDFIPSYTRTDLTDDLHEKFGFRTDYEILTNKKLNKICKHIKN